MWISLSTIAAIFFLFDVSDTLPSDNDYEIVFRDRTPSDWEDVWHKEKHARCREKLVKHLYWACEKDIYRLTRRSDPTINDDSSGNEIYYPYVSPKQAKRMLRVRRGIYKRSGTGITSECCSSSGCTWEEYAEYCPTNKRYTTYV